MYIGFEMRVIVFGREREIQKLMSVAGGEVEVAGTLDGLDHNLPYGEFKKFYQEYKFYGGLTSRPQNENKD